MQNWAVGQRNTSLRRPHEAPECPATWIKLLSHPSVMGSMMQRFISRAVSEAPQMDAWPRRDAPCCRSKRCPLLQLSRGGPLAQMASKGTQEQREGHRELKVSSLCLQTHQCALFLADKDNAICWFPDAKGEGSLSQQTLMACTFGTSQWSLTPVNSYCPTFPTNSGLVTDSGHWKAGVTWSSWSGPTNSDS